MPAKTLKPVHGPCRGCGQDMASGSTCRRCGQDATCGRPDCNGDCGNPVCADESRGA